MADAYLANVELLARFHGADGDTTYNPEIGSHTFVFAGSAELTGTFPNFGATTLSVGSGNTVTHASAGDYDYLHDGTEDYTLEFFFVSLGANGALFTNLNFSTFLGVTCGVNSGKLQYAVYGAGFSSVALVESGASDIGSSPDVYYYVAITHTVSGGLTLYLNAVSKDTDTLTSPSAAAGGSLIFGGDSAQKIENVRITRGVARTISTVPTESFKGIEGSSVQDGPLFQNIRTLAASQVLWSIAPAPLGAPSVNAVSLVAFSQAKSPLGKSSTRAVIDYSGIPGSDLNNRYFLEVSGSPVIRIPISSWQSTLQIGRANYLQCVIPNADDYLDDLTARQGSEYLAVYRGASFDTLEIAMEMSSVPLQNIDLSEGPTNKTIVVSGYSDGYTVSEAPAIRTMTGIRSRSISVGGDKRARGDIDWYLRPGDILDIGSTTISADYINYYVIQNSTSFDAYMDVGTRG